MAPQSEDGKKGLLPDATPRERMLMKIIGLLLSFMLGGVSGAFVSGRTSGEVSTSIEVAKSDIVELKQSDKDIRLDIKKVEERVNKHDAVLAATGEQYKSIMDAIGELKKKLDKLGK